MADVPTQPARPSSREYLEQLRARRMGAATTSPAAPTPVPPSPAVSIPTAVPTPTPTAQPQAPSNQPVYSQTPPVTPPPAQDPVANTSPVAESELFPGQYKPLPEETVYEWTAPSRPFKKRNRQFYTTVGLITALISMILFFAGQFLPIAVVISVAFLGYVLSSVPPESIKITITTYGIRYDNTLYYWEELGRFWFEERYEQPLVIIETARFPGRLTLLLGTTTKADLEALLSEVLLQQKPQDTFVDKSAKWLQEKIPLEIS